MPRPRLALALALASLVASARPATACENAVQLTKDDRITTLQEAEAALAESELDRARELARKTIPRHGKETIGFETPDDRLAQRAFRVLALALVRDPESGTLSEVPVALTERRHALPGPSSDADYAEALARIPGKHDEAYAILEPLARKDLVGSPDALGALHRVAKERGDEPTAYYAKARCEGMIGRSPVCNGDYARPPLIRGTTRSYLPHALLAFAALTVRMVRRRRAALGGTLSDGRFVTAPWLGHAAPLHALALLGGAFYVFARATSPTWTAIVLGAVVALGPMVERRAFFSAVRRGRIAGLLLRPTAPDDAHLPSLALYRNPAEAHTLEHDRSGAEPGYREAARRPLLRLERRPFPLWLGFVLASAFALLVAIFLLAAFALARSAP